ncbi:hypothetical protein BH10ACT11_BH10ACT11_13870 [soil metagenome]
MNFESLNRTRTILGAAASILLIVSLLFLNWYNVDGTVTERVASSGNFNKDAFICGTGDLNCTGFETFPILRWILLLVAISPAILGYILIRGHKLSYPPGEITMLGGLAATVLIGYNGILDKPGAVTAEIGVSLDYGYWLALIASILIFITGYLRSLESGGRKARQAPGTV